MKNNLLLIGAGKMAEKYIKILYALKQPFEVIGRGKYSAKKFHQRTRCIVNTGGLKSNLNKSTNHELILTIGFSQLRTYCALNMIAANTKIITITTLHLQLFITPKN